MTAAPITGSIGRRFWRHRWIGRIALLLAATAGGCGESHPDRLPVFPVWGVVTFQGQPVPLGTVTFVPLTAGPPATGQIQPDGKYTLTTYEPGDGAIAAEFEVMVVAARFVQGDPDTPGAGSQSLVPDKYSRTATSGLKVTIREGPNDIPLVLAP